MQTLYSLFSQWWLPVALTFSGAFIFHHMLFIGLWCLAKKKPFYKKVVTQINFPTLFLFLFIGVFALVDFAALPEPYGDGVFLGVELLLLLAIAWWVLRFFDGILQAQINKLKERNDRRRRASVTKLSFVYKIISLFVILLVITAIFLISPGLKTIGIGLLGSAGIAGIALGIAAQPLLLNLMAGFQLVMNKTLNIGDAVFLSGDYCTVEEINTTQVILRTWDGRRYIYPVSKFVQEPFQNWDLKDSSKIGRVSIFCNYTVSVPELRKKFESYIKTEPLFNGRVASLFVVDAKPTMMEVVCQCSADSPAELFQLENTVREEMIRFIYQDLPRTL